jgi:DNA anti-recombination protein RmuC
MEANLNVHFSAEQVAAINSLIDSKVEERMKKFQEDYDELMNKVKSKITSAIKPASLLGKTALGGAKPKDSADAAAEESKDTT